MKVKINLYGAFRRLGVSEVNLDIPEGATVFVLRESFDAYLKKSKVGISSHLLKNSVFATDATVLQDSDKLESQSPLSILPPVCGG